MRYGARVALRWAFKATIVGRGYKATRVVGAATSRWPPSVLCDGGCTGRPALKGRCGSYRNVAGQTRPSARERMVEIQNARASGAQKATPLWLTTRSGARWLRCMASTRIGLGLPRQRKSPWRNTGPSAGAMATAKRFRSTPA